MDGSSYISAPWVDQKLLIPPQQRNACCTTVYRANGLSRWEGSLRIHDQYIILKISIPNAEVLQQTAEEHIQALRDIWQCVHQSTRASILSVRNRVCIMTMNIVIIITLLGKNNDRLLDKWDLNLCFPIGRNYNQENSQPWFSLMNTRTTLEWYILVSSSKNDQSRYKLPKEESALLLMQFIYYQDQHISCLCFVSLVTEFIKE
ncbi:hypothetical protein SS50377_27466 [Spironucleus salmonicida]|uniref:Uncharacterized protein n=1 Tax=Spironucleus salmonicida TaxID=348837 RepID=V6LT16_9EUKA|nr:hypothetical protein SS50377_27464 [Spironucleus salmonicida]KAH0571166.1 hypothetical protein SS50377_27466 [Spironucleus salmonicida]|eukprot:EST46836.1 hypothetical protein SS50377_13134 [Spironucleus salmonicida]